MTDPRRVKFEPVFGGFMLETLTMGMYSEPLNAIREYVQNGFDSIRKAKRDRSRPGVEMGIVRVIFAEGGESLIIHDNGAGVSAKVAPEVLTSVGASRKDYRSEAGFRGIGRLAGIAFSDTVSFRTKAGSEPLQTEVVFDGKRMRELMSPGTGGDITAGELLTQCITVTVTDVPALAPSFFEVELSGFVDAPKECTDPRMMELYLSQVAPVPYRNDFERSADIRRHASDFGMPIEEVSVFIEAPGATPLDVRKPYKSEYQVEGVVGTVPLTDFKPYFSPNQWWWGWMGFKDEPGTYKEDESRGIRMRAKNIQIDGSGVVRDIFQKRAKSTGRYQDWFVGEIFVRDGALTPNARRDGFEDTKTWRDVRAEIAGTMCQEAGSSAQDISDKGQMTLSALVDKADKLAETLGALRRTSFSNQDRALTLSADTTKLAAAVARASRTADAATQNGLKSLATRLLDIKGEAMSGLGALLPRLDKEEIEFQVQQALLTALLSSFRDSLPAACLGAVKVILRDEFGFPRET